MPLLGPVVWRGVESRGANVHEIVEKCKGIRAISLGLGNGLIGLLVGAADSQAPAPWAATHSLPASTMMVSRCIPCFSINRYRVVRSTPAMRAAFDIFPAALLSKTVK